jgi:hypothetical protein
LETWLKKRVAGGELAIKPIELALKELQPSLGDDSVYKRANWWIAGKQAIDQTLD